MGCDFHIWKNRFHFSSGWWDCFQICNSSSSHTVKQCKKKKNVRRFFWLMRSRDSTQSRSLSSESDCQGPGHTHNQNKPSRAPVPLLPNPHWEKQNTLTHPKWLFTWHSNWSSTPYFHFQRIKQLSVYHLHCLWKLQDTTLTERSVLWAAARKGAYKTKPWQECRWARGGWNHPVDSFDMICLNLQNERGPLYGIFQSPFLWDTGSVRVNLAAVEPAFSPSEGKNTLYFHRWCSKQKNSSSKFI